MKTFFTADHHFGHKNIIKYTNRPFESVGEMDQVMADRWNSVVSPDDMVYHLGDFTLLRFAQFKSYVNRLNGIIRVVPGGHDYRWLGEYYQDVTWFKNVGVIDPLVTKTFPVNRDGSAQATIVVLCHYAMRVWDRSHYGSLHLYGHNHCTIEDPVPNSMDVGVDCNDFYPVSLEQVLEKLT